MFIADEYEIKENSWCYPYRDNIYPTLSKAKHQCSDDPSCTMFFDAEGVGLTFYLCDTDAEIQISTSGDLLHIKKGGYICMCRPVCNGIITDI